MQRLVLLCQENLHNGVNLGRDAVLDKCLTDPATLSLEPYSWESY